MKTLTISSIVLACAASLTAQEKITVPLSNASQPVTVKVHLMHGGITVTPGPAGQVIVEPAKIAGRSEERNPGKFPNSPQIEAAPGLQVLGKPECVEVPHRVAKDLR